MYNMHLLKYLPVHRAAERENSWHLVAAGVVVGAGAGEDAGVAAASAAGGALLASPALAALATLLVELALADAFAAYKAEK